MVSTLYDVVVLGQSIHGKNVVDQLLLKKPDLKIAVVAPKIYKKVENVDYYLCKSIFSEYFRGLLVLNLETRQKVFGKTLIIATGNQPILPLKEMKMTNEVYFHDFEVPINKNRNVVVLGDNLEACLNASALAQKVRHVYMLGDNITAKFESMLADDPKITFLQNAEIIDCQHDKNGKLCSVTLASGNQLKCTAIVSCLGRVPTVDGIDKRMVKIDESGYIKINLKYQTARIKTIFAYGECATPFTDELATQPIADCVLETLKEVR